MSPSCGEEEDGGEEGDGTGVFTAWNSSQRSDGSGGVLVVRFGVVWCIKQCVLDQANQYKGLLLRTGQVGERARVHLAPHALHSRAEGGRRGPREGRREGEKIVRRRIR